MPLSVLQQPSPLRIEQDVFRNAEDVLSPVDPLASRTLRLWKGVSIPSVMMPSN